ncbi:MAG: hypothetical protein U9O87_01740 [Verrucomicrobiota bacterium]|nr:hypothetical protein [Verrucomicrobiota bacterium]
MKKFLLTVSLFLFVALVVSAQDSDLNRLKNELTALNDQVLEYQLVNQVFRKPKKTLKLEDIQISSPDDLDYKTPVTPEKYAIWGRPIRMGIRPQTPKFRGHYLFLYLPKKLKKGVLHGNASTSKSKKWSTSEPYIIDLCR